MARVLQILETSEEEMLEDLENGDVAETIRLFFEQSAALRPPKKSTILVAEVDQFLAELAKMTKEEEQTHHFKKLAKR